MPKDLIRTYIVRPTCPSYYSKTCFARLYSDCFPAITTCKSSGAALSGDHVDQVYTGIVADMAKLARKLAKAEPYKSVNGSTALLTSAEHLEGISSAFGVHPSKAVRIPVQSNN